MPAIALVRLRHAPKEYWFDPNQAGAEEGDHVLVETNRGKEMGLCVDGSFEVDEKDITKPLKGILRVATEDDLAQAERMAEKGRGAMKSFRSLVEKNGLDMKPVEVDFVFDGSRATFYFTAEERVDFRALVRDLASEFHVRIDMRQIGVRDEARMLGGLGHCGEELCCRRLGGEFRPVSIRMAKEQDLPLNPAKISGLCGRLMCCLRYEFEAYKDFKGRAPKKNALIETPQGLAKVIEFDTPRENIHVRFEDGSTMALPLSSLDTGDKVAREGEKLRPCHISQEKFDELIEELHHDETLAMMGEKRFSENPELADREAEAGAIERNPHRRRRAGSGRDRGNSRRGGRKNEKREPSGRDQRKRRRSVSATVDGEPHRHHDGPAGAHDGARGSDAGGKGQNQGRNGNRRRRRRRSNSNSAQNGQGSRNGQANQHNGERRDKAKPHPGQHSSGVSGDAAHENGGASEQSRGKNKRRRRRRGGGNKGSQGNQGAKGNQGNQGQQGAPSNREGE